MGLRYEQDSHTNDTNRRGYIRKKDIKIFHPELSYAVTGICLNVHKRLGRYCREKQYSDALEAGFCDAHIVFEREKGIAVPGIANQFTNRVDFDINKTLLLEVKAKPFITKSDYYQIQRYLQASGRDLGVIVNFRNVHLKPVRIIRLNL